MSGRVGVLFVCLGNICRSPLARWIFTDLVRRRGVEHRLLIDSCGTGGWHVGGPADHRSVAVARVRGLDTDHVARQLCTADVSRFDILIAMDRSNRRGIIGAGADPTRVHLMRSFDPEAAGGPEHMLDVPDPYHDDDGFEEVYAMLERASAGLLEHALTITPRASVR